MVLPRGATICRFRRTPREPENLPRDDSSPSKTVASAKRSAQTNKPSTSSKRRKVCTIQRPIADVELPSTVAQSSNTVELPADIWMKIMEKCDFWTARALSQANRTFYNMINSSSSVGKLHVDCCWATNISTREKIDFNFRSKDGYKRKYAIELNRSICRNDPFIKSTKEGFQICSSNEELIQGHFAERCDFVFDKISIHTLRVDMRWRTMLDSLIVILERNRLSIFVLDLNFTNINSEKSFDTARELREAARIVQLAKPAHLKFTSKNSFTHEELHEHFLATIMNQKFASIAINNNSTSISSAERFQLPKVRLIDLGHHWRTPSPLHLVDVVDILDEWSREEREIVRYRFSESFGKSNEAVGMSAAFEQLLRDRKLPIRFEKSPICRGEFDKIKIEYRIRKTTPRSDDQDELFVCFEMEWWGKLTICNANARTKNERDSIEKNDCAICCRDESWSFSRLLYLDKAGK